MAGISSQMSKTSCLMYKTRPKPNKYVNPVVCIGWRNNVQPRLPNLYIHKTPPLRTTHLLPQQFHSLSAGARGDVSASSFSGSKVGDTSGVHGTDLPHKVKKVWQSPHTGEKAKEDLDEMTPHVEQLLTTHQFLRDRIIPVGGTTMGTIAALFLLTWIFRRFRRYSEQESRTFLSKPPSLAVKSYVNSVWGALEVPVKYLVTFMAFLQIGVTVAPTMIPSQYIIPTRRGAVVLSFVWFLLKWVNHMGFVDLNEHSTLVTILSAGFLVLSGMALAHACGVSVKSILTVAGIGGAVTTFAGQEIISNVLSGWSLRLSPPFSPGDFIKAASVEGMVKEIGTKTTTFMRPEGGDIIVPNSWISRQVIVNKSRGGWCAIQVKFYVLIDDLSEMSQICEEIRKMITSRYDSFLGREEPYCFWYPTEGGVQLIFGCNLKQMGNEQLRITKRNIFQHSAEIMLDHTSERNIPVLIR